MFKMPRPELRPRGAGLRVLNFFLGALLVLMVIGLVLLVSSFISLKRASFEPSGMEFATKLMLLFPILTALVLAGQFHAYLGTPQEFGKMATPLQMWRDKTLRELPTLPPLPAWKIVLIYLLPLLTASAFSGLMLRERPATDFHKDLRTTGYQVQRMQHVATRQFIQVGCQDFPVPAKTADSLCFIMREETAGQTFDNLMKSWVYRMQSWLEWRDLESEPIRHQPDALPQLKVWKGGGFLGGSQAFELRVPSEALQDDLLLPFQLDYLNRDGPTANAIPADFQEQADWLARQSFHSYLVVTPLQK